MSTEKIFARVDKNKDGKISWEEFFKTIRKIDEMFKEVNVNSDGQIDIVEFASCLVFSDGEEHDDEETVMKKAFDLYDIDGDGKISASEIHVVLKRLGEKHMLEECIAMVQAVDVDGDGFVSFDEFKTMMSSENKKSL